MTGSQPRLVLCMRWGTLYPPAYVNVLFNAVRDHLNGAVRFVCFSNDATGLDDGIEVRPIPDLGFADKHWASGAWPKLSVFLDTFDGLNGRALFIDLDSVIVGNLEPFFEAEGALLGIGVGAGWRRGGTGSRPDLGTGVFAFDMGSLSHIPKAFSADADAAFSTFGLEQRLVEDQVPSWQPWPTGWVISFKRHLCQPIGLDRIRQPFPPSPDAKIVAFHGDPRPVDVISADGHNWASFPRFGRSPVPWVREYWLKYGGKSFVAQLDQK